MARHISDQDARSRFGEITEQVRSTGEPVIVEKHGEPFVAVISLADLAEVERMRRTPAEAWFTRLAAEAGREERGPGPSDDAVVEAVRLTREKLFRERYGGE